MDKNTKIIITNLIDILLNSCTDRNSNDETTSHEHNLFDNIDKNNLMKLIEDINSEKAD